MKQIILQESIGDKIYFVRGKKVMLDTDLAVLYGVKTKILIQSVKRNIERFPNDFMFQLSWDEAKNLRSQIVTLRHGEHRKYQPYVFTEQGIAMLSSVLRSKRAIIVNVAIMRAFVKLREVLFTHKELAEKFGLLEQKVGKHDHEIQVVIQAIQKLIEASKESPKEPPPKRRIGFHQSKYGANPIAPTLQSAYTINIESDAAALALRCKRSTCAYAQVRGGEYK